MSARRYVSDDVAEWKLSMVATWPVPAFWPHARGGQHDGDLDPTAGIKAAELLIAELQRARSRKNQARIASRVLTEELEKIDARILVAKNSEPTSLPDVDDRLVPAWDQQRGGGCGPVRHCELRDRQGRCDASRTGRSSAKGTAGQR
jgi:hypothetical protein